LSEINQASWCVVDYDPREEAKDLHENKVVEDVQEFKNEIQQNQLFIQSLQDELTITKTEAKMIKIEKLKADATILELTKQLASFCLQDEKQM
jgi:protein subunit release factor B